jgi:predicted membrane GTPase involved in stress response
VESSKVQKIIKKFAMNEVNLQTAYSGDIVSIGGFMNSTVTDTINLLG